MIQTDFVLQIPNIVISPNIDELQNHFNIAINSLFEAHKSITIWGQQYNKKTEAVGESGTKSCL